MKREINKGVAEREPVTRRREPWEGGVLPKSEIFFGLLYYPMSDASKPCQIGRASCRERVFNWV